MRTRSLTKSLSSGSPVVEAQENTDIQAGESIKVGDPMVSKKRELRKENSELNVKLDTILAKMEQYDKVHLLLLEYVEKLRNVLYPPMQTTSTELDVENLSSGSTPSKPRVPRLPKPNGSKNGILKKGDAPSACRKRKVRFLLGNRKRIVKFLVATEE